MLTKVRTYIKDNNLLEPYRPVVVGVSGGADSIALLTVLVELGYCCIAAHCNFHLRGEESMRDENFVRDYTKNLNVPFVKIDFNTSTYAESHHISIEMAARELRYEWFDKLIKEYKAQAIAVAHHQDDSIETVLLNLIRGTGIKGVAGIKAKNNHIVRPFLCVGREDILSWLSDKNISFVTDSTNLSDTYMRNFIRLRVIPLLQELTPSVKTTILRSVDNLDAALHIYNNAINIALKDIFIDHNIISIDRLLAFSEPKTLLYEALIPYEFSRLVVEEIYKSLKGESGKLFYSPTYELIKDRETLILNERKEDREEQYEISSIENWYGPIELSFHQVVISSEFEIEKNSDIAYFDLDKLIFPLKLRHWQDGDSFIPFGMKGRKKLSDYFTSQKLNRNDKKKIWLLCSGEDILWVIGMRTDNRFSITETTKNVLIVKFFPGKNQSK